MKQFRAALILFILTIFFPRISHVQGQNQDVTTLKIHFLQEEPIIDGLRDEFLASASLQQFAEAYSTSGDSLVPDASYFLGYTAHFLYILLEYPGDSIICRDRAYQNGDGFHFTIGKPVADGQPTGKFYVFGFSPSRDWSRKIRWYHDIDLSMKRLGEEVGFQFGSVNGKSCFELLIPWQVMKPYHPWCGDSLAFNLCFVKAMNENDKGYYFMTMDERMQSEQSKRKYLVPQVDLPKTSEGFYALPVNHNMTAGEVPQLDFFGYSEPGSVRDFSVSLINEEGNVVSSERLTESLVNGRNHFRRDFSQFKMEPGVWKLRVGTGLGMPFEHSVVVMETFDSLAFQLTLEKSRWFLSEGSYQCLRFDLEETKSSLEGISGETAEPALLDVTRQINAVHQLLVEEKDPYLVKTGTFRRAFISDIDDELQPYSVYIPESFDPGKAYPLLVYLHGSGQDDRALFSSVFPKEEFIVLAPNGRGTSNCYATEEAQKDIREAIADVVSSYPIRIDRIILSGFSMGGYGALRTYYESPEQFCAVAVLSGHPDLANQWRPGEGQINFLNEEQLHPFVPVPVFVFHGEKDLNCHFPLIQEFVDALKKLGTEVTFLTDPEAGHQAMNEELSLQYFEWLRELIK